MPQTLLEQWEHELLAIPESARNAERRRRMEGYLDAGHGACWLRDPRIAALLETALLHFDGIRYRLICWCVMPNHLHFVIETATGWSIAKVMYDLKSFTAKQANRLLGRSGSFWQRDYYDRYMRDGEHLAFVVRYIEENPVKARLVGATTDWSWSSAKFREMRGT